jgi:hypothetical protein
MRIAVPGIRRRGGAQLLPGCLPLSSSRTFLISSRVIGIDSGTGQTSTVTNHDQAFSRSTALAAFTARCISPRDEAAPTRVPYLLRLVRGDAEAGSAGEDRPGLDITWTHDSAPDLLYSVARTRGSSSFYGPRAFTIIRLRLAQTSFPRLSSGLPSDPSLQPFFQLSREYLSSLPFQ